jgi:hypothetical protein
VYTVINTVSRQGCAGPPLDGLGFEALCASAAPEACAFDETDLEAARSRGR